MVLALIVVVFGKRVLPEKIFLSLVCLWWLVAAVAAAGKPMTRLFLLTWPTQLTVGEEGSSVDVGSL